MLELKIGIQLASLRQPFRQALHTASRLGASSVEIDARSELRPAELSQTAARQVRKMLEDLNLGVSSVTFRTRRGYDAPDELERRIAATKEAMDMAYRLGAPFVVNHVGNVAAGPESPGWRWMIEALADLGRYSQRSGAMLLAETGGESGAELQALLSTLPPGTLGIDLNPGRLIVAGFSPQEVVRTLSGHILHVHATDGVRDLGRGRGIEVQLGRGSVDYAELLGALEEQDYRGDFTIERTGADDPVQEIGQAVQYLKSL